MNEDRTSSILQRAPVILAVTAASYGLRQQAHAGSADSATGALKPATNGSRGALRARRPMQELALQD